MDRRTLLKTGGMALASLGANACTRQIVSTVPALPRGRGPVNLAPVRVSMDRIIRTTVGLRPHRDGGFRLEAEKLDGKTVIHNYGHGGTGMSLSWGLGLMCAELAQDTGERRVAVIGCGAPGLCAARQLQRRGFDVTIYAATIPPDTTSNKSWAGFTPTTALIEPDRRTPEWDAKFRRAAEISYQQLQTMIGSTYGVYWIDSYSVTDDPTQQRRGGGAEAGLVPQPLRPQRDREVLGPGEHPFPAKYAIRTPNLAIEPPIYLDALIRDCLLFGGRIVIRKFDTRNDLAALTEPVLVNCTGLGSLTLFDDQELVPIRGQLTFIVPQPEVTYRASGRAGMNPRSDGIVIGNSQDRGNWSLDPDDAIIERVMTNAMAFFAGMRPANPALRLTRSSTPQTLPRLETFFQQADQ